MRTWTASSPAATWCRCLSAANTRRMPNAGWEDGDWNADPNSAAVTWWRRSSRVATSRASVAAAVSAVPEPHSVMLVLLGLAGCWAWAGAGTRRREGRTVRSRYLADVQMP